VALTKSQVNKLGERLRHEPTIDAEGLERLQELRALYDAPMAKAQAVLKEKLGLDATSRLKTVNTIMEKLRREKTRLAEMQDIAGLRIVEEMGLGAQSQMFERETGERRSRSRCGSTQCIFSRGSETHTRSLLQGRARARD